VSSTLKQLRFDVVAVRGCGCEWLGQGLGGGRR
jgi:hypothetical protein